MSKKILITLIMIGVLGSATEGMELEKKKLLPVKPKVMPKHKNDNNPFRTFNKRREDITIEERPSKPEQPPKKTAYKRPTVRLLQNLQIVKPSDSYIIEKSDNIRKLGTPEKLWIDRKKLDTVGLDIIKNPNYLNAGASQITFDFFQNTFEECTKVSPSCFGIYDQIDPLLEKYPITYMEVTNTKKDHKKEENTNNKHHFHLKSLIIPNEEVVYWGSPNLTSNAFENNAEFIIKDTSLSAVCAYHQASQYIPEMVKESWENFKNNKCQTVTKNQDTWQTEFLKNLGVDQQNSLAIQIGKQEKKMFLSPDTLVIFAPTSDMDTLLASFVQKAEKQVVMSAMSFNPTPTLNNTLLEIFKKNIPIKIFINNTVGDKGEAKGEAKGDFVKKAKQTTSQANAEVIKIQMTKPNPQYQRGRGLYHVKFIVIDDKYVLYTTANFSTQHWATEQWYITSDPKMVYMAVNWAKLYYNSEKASIEKLGALQQQPYNMTHFPRTTQNITKEDNNKKHKFRGENTDNTAPKKRKIVTDKEIIEKLERLLEVPQEQQNKETISSVAKSLRDYYQQYYSERNLNQNEAAEKIKLLESKLDKLRNKKDDKVYFIIWAHWAALKTLYRN